MRRSTSVVVGVGRCSCRSVIFLRACCPAGRFNHVAILEQRTEAGLGVGLQHATQARKM